VPRNAEVIRQWTILREIEQARGSGVTIDELASKCGVTTRTIRRDLYALEEAGFPLYDDRATDDGRTRWRVNGQALKGLAAGLTMSELCALYFSRTLVESLSAAVFRDDVESAFEKLSSGLTPHMRQFLDQLPRVIATKPDSLGRPISANSATQVPRRQQQLIGRALDAILNYRQAAISYYSKSSERQKDYLVHPYRLAHAQGALYLLAYVPEYVQVRTFAVERIRSLTLLDERFTPIEELPDVAFPHSLGVHSGPPERVEIAFQPAVADYIRSREWHPSQHLQECDNRGVVMSLDVCIDRALRSWILSFGPLARIVSPGSLADDIAGQLETARAQYQSVHGTVNGLKSRV
jgi:predicted DNA-binding transcriptional regulator YafY